MRSKWISTLKCFSRYYLRFANPSVWGENDFKNCTDYFDTCYCLSFLLDPRNKVQFKLFYTIRIDYHPNYCYQTNIYHLTALCKSCLQHRLRLNCFSITKTEIETELEITTENYRELQRTAENCSKSEGTQVGTDRDRNRCRNSGKSGGTSAGEDRDKVRQSKTKSQR